MPRFPSLILIHTSVKLVTKPFIINVNHGNILIHTSVKLVTFFNLTKTMIDIILIHTSVKLVTLCRTLLDQEILF